jgi:DNA (cytosine-5)-methyltransferase 1
MLKVGSDFSGVGAFNQALTRLGVEYQEIFACDMDKYARQTFIHNYGEPKYYPTNVYDREIPSESLDIYMTSPPCQAFSLAGKRLGKDDKRGILFFNSYEFIQKNNPRFFIFENVKGLLSDDGGNTFQEWINMLGGRSVNGLPILFPYDNALPYHLYWQVLNAKHHGVPQNRERVFLIGIRDDKDNNFRFPAEEHLSKRLKDALEEEVNDKYFLSEKMMELITYGKVGNYEIANINKGGQKGSVQSENGKAIGCLSAADYKLPKLIQVKSATSKGYEEATEGDSINFSVPNSETRRGRVGKGVAQTLDTGCNQGVMVSKEVRTQESKYERKKTGSNNFRGKEIEFRNQYHMNAITTSLTNDHLIESNHKIRRLTPRECFRLMDFPDTFTWPVSDSQAYKQAGNSIVVRVLEKIIKNILQI